MNIAARFPRRAAYVRGFSLIELAISLAIVAVLITGLLVPMATQIGQRKVAVTEKTLEDVKNALLGFAAAHGRLPCPASDPGGGVEAFAPAGGGNPAGDATNGRCLNSVGFVPGRTLSLTPLDADGYVLDGWGTRLNRVRYAVALDPVTTVVPNVTNPFTRIDGIRAATLGEIAKMNSLLHVCDSGTGVQAGVSCNTAKTLTSTAVVVIWSVGANAATGGTGADERENPNPRYELSADRIFVSHAPSDVGASTFDDVITWLSFHTVANRMVAAGQLP